MREELKPCPFCGGEPEMIHAVLEEYHSVNPELICRECGYRIKAKNLAIVIADSPKENCKFLDRQTIRIWNTRPVEYALTAEVERLKEALKKIANLRNTNPGVHCVNNPSCAEDAFCNLFCAMGDIAITAVSTPEKGGEDE